MALWKSHCAKWLEKWAKNVSQWHAIGYLGLYWDCWELIEQGIIGRPPIASGGKVLEGGEGSQWRKWSLKSAALLVASDTNVEKIWPVWQKASLLSLRLHLLPFYGRKVSCGYAVGAWKAWEDRVLAHTSCIRHHFSLEAQGIPWQYSMIKWVWACWRLQIQYHAYLLGPDTVPWAVLGPVMSNYCAKGDTLWSVKSNIHVPSVL